MPPSRLKPSELAVEAKRTYIPYIERMLPQYPARSFVYVDSSLIQVAPSLRRQRRLRIAVIDGDPIEVALDWYEANVKSARNSLQGGGPVAELSRIPVVNMANEKRAGGDWEAGVMAFEECFCRRSNLVHALNTVVEPAPVPHYPLAQKSGLFSPFVVVYRSGPESYQVWSEFKPLPVISVAPVCRPKLDTSGTKYAFEQEKELMLEKIRTVLRIAARHQFEDLCLGGFGVSDHFKNPVAEVASMWRTILFTEPEFYGVFTNIVFAIERQEKALGEGIGAYDVFKKEFDPSNIFRSPYI